MKHNYSIESNHIILVPMDEQTSELYRKLRNREDNRNFFFDSAVIEKEQQAKWFQNYLKKENEYMFAVLLKETMEFVGGIGIYDIDLLQRTAEIGRIIIDKNMVSGRGYGTEAIRGIANIFRKYFALKKIYAYIYANNVASVKAFLKADFIKDSTDENSEAIKVYLSLE